MAAEKGKKRTSKVARASSRTKGVGSPKRATRGAKPATKPKPRPTKAKKAKKREPQTNDDMVVCGAHGDTPVTFVCRHVAEGTACGFHAGPPAPDNPWPDAWCDRCDEAFQAGGGEWNEQNEGLAEIELLCTHCYEDARARNADVPRLARGAAASLTKEEAAELIHHAVHSAQALQDRVAERWHLGRMARWDFDAETGTLTFTDPSRGPVVADVQLVGSYSTTSNTFQWVWETLEEGAPEARSISRLRVFGEVRGISALTTPNWECDEAEGWEMTALAAHILGADGMYRAPMEHLRWFMLLSNVRSLN